MAAIVTTNMRVYAAQQFISGFSNPLQNLYLTIGRTLPWTGNEFNDNAPPTPVDDVSELSAAYRDMLSAKLISPSDVSLVAPRYDWTSGTIYTQYTNSSDLFDPSGGLAPFFVLTDTLNVYKCLNNSKNGVAVASTVKPTGTGTSVINCSDGYQWKYMFTVSSSDVLKFVTNEWIPVKTLTTNDASSQWIVQQAAIPGTIDRIDMVSIGSQYTIAPSVQIVGDGVNASAAAVISGGNVQYIIVTNPGQGYTWARITIVPAGGNVGANGAVANAVISPFEGHGSDPITELGAFYVMVNSKLTYDESGTFTVSNDFRRIGILKNPLLNDAVSQAVALDYNQMTRLSFGTMSGATFVPDEIVQGSLSNATGIVVDYDSSGLVLRVAETIGNFIPGETIIGSEATGVLQSYVGQAVSATSTTIVLSSTASAAADAYTGQTIRITSGTGLGQIAKITGYVGVNRTATVTPAWNNSYVPNGTSGVSIAKITSPDLNPFSGEYLYLENRRPIARASDQVEDIKIVVEF
jgi:hypothetical protein